MSTFKRVAIAILALAITAVTLGIIGVAPGSASFQAKKVKVSSSAEETQRGCSTRGVTARGRCMEVRTRKERSDPLCEKIRNRFDEPGRCERVLIFRSTDRYPATTPTLEAERGNIRWCIDWELDQRGIYWINWREEMRGSYCYVSGPSAPDIWGLHQKCGYGHAYAVTIDCEDWRQRRTGDTTYGWWISAYDKFDVSVGVRGLNFTQTYQMHVNQHPTGSTWGYYN